jgi:hypothetical protein
MRTRTTGGYAIALSLLVVLAAASLPAHSEGWRDRKIDGKSAARFETSVAALQSELPQERREEFEVALAIVWIRNATDVNDLDHNGRFDLDDLQLLKDDSLALLTAIDRGNLVGAIEEREKQQNKYSLASYLKDLDGLGYDEVIALAGYPDTYSAVVRRLQKPSKKTAAEYYRGPALRPTTAKALNDATLALNAKQLAAARSAVGKLKLDQLRPYERAKTELILYQIAATEQNFGEAREHLVSAIASGGLSDADLVLSLKTIGEIDSWAAATAQ